MAYRSDPVGHLFIWGLSDAGADFGHRAAAVLIRYTATEVEIFGEDDANGERGDDFKHGQTSLKLRAKVAGKVSPCEHFLCFPDTVGKILTPFVG